MYVNAVSYLVLFSESSSRLIVYTITNDRIAFKRISCLDIFISKIYNISKNLSYCSLEIIENWK